MSHVHLATDDIKFLGEFIRGKRGVLHDVAENIYRHTRAGVRHVNVIDRAIKARVGVHVTARFLYFLINAAAGASGRAFEQHMFQHMRQPRAEPATLVNAASHGPRLCRNHGRAVIFARDDGEAVFERHEFDAVRDGRDRVVGRMSHRVNKLRAIRVFGKRRGAIHLIWGVFLFHLGQSA